MKLNGNKTLLLQRATYTANSIGEQEASWTDYRSARGYLDMMSGTSRWQEFNAKVTEATHVFMCDYAEALLLVDPSELRAEIDGVTYDVLYIDCPVGKNLLIEIYLKRTGLDND